MKFVLHILFEDFLSKFKRVWKEVALWTVTPAGFTSLHPDDACYSSATHITDHPYIFGHYSHTDQGSIACLFKDGTVNNLVDPSEILHSRVHAEKYMYAIIYGFDGGNHKYFAYSSLVSINNHGTALGYPGIWHKKQVLNKLMITNTSDH